MADPHITFDLWTAAEEGRLDRESLTNLYVRHLQALCGPCDVAIQAALDEAAGDGTAVPVRRPFDVEWSDEENIDSLLAAAQFRRVRAEIQDTFRRKLHEALAEFRSEEDRASKDLPELLRLVDAGRGEEAVAKVRRARTRFATLTLSHDLLDEARASLPDRPARALHLAQAAERVANRMKPESGLLEGFRGIARALALAHEANALRALDRLAEADQTFELVRHFLRRFEVVEPEVLAEVDALEGSLRRAQRRFDDSERLLQRAAAHYAAAEDALGLARVLLTLGSLGFHAGRPQEALAHAEAALRTLPADAPPRLRLCGEHNRVFYLCELGHFDIAAELLAEARPLYDGMNDPWTRHRLAWVEGKIAHGLGDEERARERLTAARDGFRQADAAYDTALVSLELAELHLEAGRPDAARTLARETVALFQALEVPREAAMALAQLRRAAQAEERGAEEGAALTAALLRATARALRRA